jgi:hypothetical protein
VIARLKKTRELPLGFCLFVAHKRYLSALYGKEFALMGILMIRCPKTGRAISTGTYVESAAFRSSPVFFGQTYCPHCDTTHEWFARDAWVRDSGPFDEAERERQIV